MKKALYFIFILILGNNFCLADDVAEVKKFFNTYVEAANSYDTDYFKYYSDNAKIKRVVEKPDGSTKTVDIPLDRYKNEAKK